MIARTWRATATPEGAASYARYFEHTLRPALDTLHGHHGALVLVDAGRITVITLWASLDAIRAFAGADIGRAVVEPEARELLHTWDEHVAHAEVAVDTRR